MLYSSINLLAPVRAHQQMGNPVATDRIHSMGRFCGYLSHLIRYLHSLTSLPCFRACRKDGPKTLQLLSVAKASLPILTSFTIPKSLKLSRQSLSCLDA